MIRQFYNYYLSKNKTFAYDSIATNEWICPDSGLNYHYIFRYFGKEAAKASVREVTIGIITQDYKTPFENVPIGVGDCKHSFSWYYGGPKHSRSFFYHCGKNINKTKLDGILLGPAASKSNDTTSDKADNFESYYYFGIEINMNTKLVTFMGAPMAHIKNMQFSIENVNKPFRIAVSLLAKKQQDVGLGIVHCTQ